MLGKHHSVLMLLPSFSVEERAGKSVLLPQQAHRRMQLLEENNPSQIRSQKTRRELGHTFLPPAVHGKAVCGDHEGIVWLSLLSTYCCTLK